MNSRQKSILPEVILLLFLFLSSHATAQEFCRSILEKARSEFKGGKGDLDKALATLQDADLCDFQNVLQKERLELQDDIFAAIKRQKERALKEEINAKDQAARAELEKEKSALLADYFQAVNQNKPESAKNILSKLLDKYGDSQDLQDKYALRLEIADLYAQSQEYVEADFFYEQAIHLAPNQEKASCYLARKNFLLKTRQTEKLLENYFNLVLFIESEPEYQGPLLDSLYANLKMLGDNSLAVPFFKSLIKKNTAGKKFYHHQLVEYYESAGMKDEAVSELEAMMLYLGEEEKPEIESKLQKLKKIAQPYKGSVLNKQDLKPIANVTVSFFSMSYDSLLAVLTSDSSGNYTAELLPQEIFKIKYDAPGYLDWAQILSTQDNQNLEIQKAFLSPINLSEPGDEEPITQVDSVFLKKIAPVFKRYKYGVYTIGKLRPMDFIEKNRALIKRISGFQNSAISVVSAVSLNIGNLEAVNTGDENFLSFGIFAWSIGQGNGKGELPALLLRLKNCSPESFQKYFGRYGLDISPSTDEIYGYFTLNGVLISTQALKETFRADHWATVFWEAGQDSMINAIQIVHAMSRLETFYWKIGKAPTAYPLADLVTSELGVALLLDNHVERPGYVRTCIERALVQTGLGDPGSWTTKEELLLIEAYLDIRKTYGKFPMPHAGERGDRLIALAKAGKLSSERGSFKYRVN